MEQDSIFTENGVQNRKKEPKMMPKETKMEPEGCQKGPKWCQEGAKMEPKGEPKRARNLQKGTLWKSIDLGAKKDHRALRFGAILGSFLVKNRCKNRCRKSYEN